MKELGGPAFPTQYNQDGCHGGMTLRDWFAGQALIGLLSFSPADVTGQMAKKDAAQDAYAIADAMLAQRLL